MVERRALSVGLILWALFAFSIAQVAECPVGVGAGSHGAAHDTAEQAHSRSAHIGPEGIGPGGHRCHHDAGRQHMGTTGKLYAAPRRLVDPVDTAPAGPDAAGWSAAGALILLGVQRRGPPPSVSRSFPSGRHILISTGVART
jgi:hypothetical protein